MPKRLLSTRLFTVEHREYAGPGGDAVGRDVVVHPGAVVILPLLSDGRIVFIRNYRYTVERELCELPAGTREPRESPADTAIRELEEETGFRAGHIEPFATFYTSPGVMTEQMHAFLATNLEEVGQNLVEDERIRVEWVSAQEARRRLIAGELEDAKTMAVLGLYFARGTR